MTAPTLLADRYDLHEVIGRGGMADVHRATDRVLSREVAVKVLRETTDTDTDRARFTTEARTLARLSHVGLVTVLDAGTTSEQPFLVMELVTGPTLARACSDGPLGPERAGEIGAQVAEALAYAHAQDVVHRDVKPGNVLLSTDNRVKLADFGIARLIGDTVRHTRTGHAIGTAAYLAPEQVEGKEVSGATDVYSLGLVLLETLTGERAYPGSPTEAALARLHRPPAVPDSLPAGWRSLLTAMTALDPQDRPTAAEVARRLRGFADGTAESVPDGATQVLPVASAAVPTVPQAAPAPGHEPARATPLIDRLGDDLARHARTLVARARSMPPHQVGVAAAVGALVLLMIVVAFAAGGGSPEGSEVPERTPSRLQQPLQDLHDAVHEE